MKTWLRHLRDATIICLVLLLFVAVLVGLAVALTFVLEWLGPIIGTGTMVIIAVLAAATVSWWIEERG